MLQYEMINIPLGISLLSAIEWEGQNFGECGVDETVVVCRYTQCCQDVDGVQILRISFNAAIKASQVDSSISSAMALQGRHIPFEQLGLCALPTFLRAQYPKCLSQKHTDMALHSGILTCRLQRLIEQIQSFLHLT